LSYSPFVQKAQKAIDALWENGVINGDTIEEWGEEHMRTPYQRVNSSIIEKV
jgi:hypothetical protein